MPSLTALHSFDAVARCGSITAAARELCVTQGAVSHQISALDEWFGKELFLRNGRGLRLSDAGRELAEATESAFALLSEACMRLARPGGRELDLAAPGSFLAHWMVPRLEDFEQAHPGIRLRLRTDGDYDDLRAGRIDALIVCGTAPWPVDIAAVEVAPERIGPVCAKKWVRGTSSDTWLAGVPRLGTDSRPEAWKEWARAADRTLPRQRTRRFDHLTPLLEAARAGLGVAMAPELLVRGDLAEGRLHAPLGFVDSGLVFALAVLQRRRDEDAIASLRRWLEASP